MVRNEDIIFLREGAQRPTAIFLKKFLPKGGSVATDRKSVAAGVLIALGAILKLRVGGHLGNLLFSIGLISIIAFDLNLYTGKVGKLVGGEIKVLPLLRIFAGNFIGAWLMGLYGFMDAGVHDAAAAIIKNQMEMNAGSLFVAAMGCGMLMYLGTAAQMKTMAPWTSIAAVVAFIEAGFAHSVADMAYMSLGNCFSLPVLFIVAAGNAAGACILSFLTADTCFLSKGGNEVTDRSFLTKGEKATNLP